MPKGAARASFGTCVSSPKAPRIAEYIFSIFYFFFQKMMYSLRESVEKVRLCSISSRSTLQTNLLVYLNVPLCVGHKRGIGTVREEHKDAHAAPFGIPGT